MPQFAFCRDWHCVVSHSIRQVEKFHHDIRSKNIDSLDDVEWRGERISRKAEREDSVIERFNFEEAVYGRVQSSFHQDSLPRQDVATFIIALDLFSKDEFNIGLFSFEIYDKNNSVFQNYLINLSDLLPDEEKTPFLSITLQGTVYIHGSIGIIISFNNKALTLKNIGKQTIQTSGLNLQNLIRSL